MSVITRNPSPGVCRLDGPSPVAAFSRQLLPDSTHPGGGSRQPQQNTGAAANAAPWKKREQKIKTILCVCVCRREGREGRRGCKIYDYRQCAPWFASMLPSTFSPRPGRKKQYRKAFSSYTAGGKVLKRTRGTIELISAFIPTTRQDRTGGK